MSNRSDLIERKAAIDVLDDGAELLRRALDAADIVGVERAKYEWGLWLIESYISDMKELPSASTKVHSAYEVDKGLLYELERGSSKDAAAIIYEWQIKRELQSKLIQQADEIGAIDYIREDGPINTRNVRFTASLNIAKEEKNGAELL